MYKSTNTLTIYPSIIASTFVMSDTYYKLDHSKQKLVQFIFSAICNTCRAAGVTNMKDCRHFRSLTGAITHDPESGPVHVSAEKAAEMFYGEHRNDPLEEVMQKTNADSIFEREMRPFVEEEQAKLESKFQKT